MFYNKCLFVDILLKIAKGLTDNGDKNTEIISKLSDSSYRRSAFKDVSYGLGILLQMICSTAKNIVRNFHKSLQNFIYYGSKNSSVSSFVKLFIDTNSLKETRLNWLKNCYNIESNYVLSCSMFIFS